MRMQTATSRNFARGWSDPGRPRCRRGRLPDCRHIPLVRRCPGDAKRARFRRYGSRCCRPGCADMMRVAANALRFRASGGGEGFLGRPGGAIHAAAPVPARRAKRATGSRRRSPCPVAAEAGVAAIANRGPHAISHARSAPALSAHLPVKQATRRPGRQGAR